jgi:hypothetical protein
MRRFVLRRVEDVTGVSGPGVIAEGIEFARGRVVLDWRTATPGTTIFDSIEDMLAVHGHAGKTVVEWIDANSPVAVIPAVLGWANPDTGPNQMRLYALDDGPNPRWAKPHARTLETALDESCGLFEGMHAVLTVETTKRGGQP